MARSATLMAVQSWDQKPNLVLVGMPSSGKTTVGRLLADEWGLRFVDTDRLIEKHTGLRLQQLVNRRGLRNFREIEQQVICDLEGTGQIISTGGSVIYGEAAMSHLSDVACVAYLQLGLPTMLRRLHNIDSRGLAKMPGHSLQTLFQRRAPLYLRWADRIVPNNWPMTALRRDQLIHGLRPDQ